MRRRLDVELVRRGLARSRGEAADAIRAGRVTVAGAPATTAARLVAAGEAVHIETPRGPYVSRGGYKLAAALDAFRIDLSRPDGSGLRALDAGASTGGFTDCLLQRGAGHVVAVDVGHGQLAWQLRSDPRVTVMDRTNVRDLDVDMIGELVELVAADLSFISLRTVAPALRRVATTAAPFVLLVKPQFEAGRSRVGKGGVVRDGAVRRAVLGEVVEALGEEGLGAVAARRSPITGADGNVEILVLARTGPATVDPGELDRACADVADEPRGSDAPSAASGAGAELRPD